MSLYNIIDKLNGYVYNMTTNHNEHWVSFLHFACLQIYHGYIITSERGPTKWCLLTNITNSYSVYILARAIITSSVSSFQVSDPGFNGRGCLRFMYGVTGESCQMYLNQKYRTPTTSVRTVSVINHTRTSQDNGEMQWSIITQDFIFADKNSASIKTASV